MKNTSRLPKYIKLNEAVRPQDNFYQYVCHHWCQDNPLPADRGSWSHFSKLQEKIHRQIKTIIHSWQASSDLRPEQEKVVTLYENYKQRHKYYNQSLKTLLKLRQNILDVKPGPKALAQVLALSSLNGLSSFISLDVTIDTKNSQRHCLFIDPPDLALPDRDYYLSASSKMRHLRQAYLKFLKKHQKQMTAAGFEYAIEPDKILEIETDLAKLSWPIYKAVNIEKTHNPFSWEDLNEQFPFNWSTYFQFAEISPPTDLIVSQPPYLREALKYLETLDFDLLQQYLLQQLALSYGSLLGDKFQKTKFEFFGLIVSGRRKMESLEKRAVDYVNQALCDVIGQAYIQEHFSASQREDAQTVASEVSAALRRRLAENSWMSEKSKKYAQGKLDKIVVNIGYSNFWANYDDLKLSRNNPVLNSFNIQKHRRQRYLDLLGQKTNRRAFGDIQEEVQLANAWTEIFLLNTNYPAGFLQPPFYDHRASLAYNLGSLGMTIGHELTHNFDQAGANVDQDGNLNPWLTKNEQRAFKKATAKLMKTAKQHSPAPKIKMKGKQVIDELIADLGG